MMLGLGLDGRRMDGEELKVVAVGAEERFP